MAASVLAVLVALAALPAIGAGATPAPADEVDAVEVQAVDEVGWTTIAALGRPPAPSPTAAAADVLAEPAVAGAFEPTPCFVPPPPGTPPDAVRCGYVGVPLDHDDPAGPAIRLAVAVREATGPDPADDPLLVLAGGPGEHLVVGLPSLLADGGPFGAVNARRDVVLLDQRGVGFSEPSLACPETLAVRPGGDVLDQFAAALATCRARLVDAGVDLSAFDTENAAADLDVARTALGYPAWNVFGTSYGARLGLQAARVAPSGIRSLALSSPIPAEANFVADAGPSFQRALDELFAACAATSACRGPHGDVAATLEAVLARLAAAPAQVEVTDPATGAPITVTVHASDVANALHRLFYATAAVPAIPALIAAMGEGDFRTIVATSLAPASQLFISQGMQLSFLCAEEVPRTSPTELAASAASLSTAAQLVVASSPIIGLGVFDLCAMWDVERSSDTTFAPITTDVPTLVVTGRFDQITPPRYGEAVAAALSDDVLVAVPDAGHSPLLGIGACGLGILTDFVADPAAPPDVACATDRRPAFVPSLTGGPPDAGHLPPITAPLHAAGGGDPDGAGLASLWVAEDASQLCWTIRTTGLDPPTAAHLHAGAAGEPAPVVLALPPAGGPAWGGCTAPPASAGLAALADRPQDHWVDVHTGPFPDGAVRGPAAADAASDVVVDVQGRSHRLPAGPGTGPLPGLVAPVVDLASAPDDVGTWVVAADGGVFALRGAGFHGSLGGTRLVAPVVAIAPTPTGEGYWLAAADGGVFAFGDAEFHGSAGGLPLARPVVDIAPSPTGHGYWLVAADGGVLTYGDARFHGAAGGLPLNAPVVALAAAPLGEGYTLVAADGGVFTYGEAGWFGSAGGLPLRAPVLDVAASPTGLGYRLLAADGGTFAYGDARFLGTVPPGPDPLVAID